MLSFIVFFPYCLFRWWNFDMKILYVCLIFLTWVHSINNDTSPKCGLTPLPYGQTSGQENTLIGKQRCSKNSEITVGFTPPSFRIQMHAREYVGTRYQMQKKTLKWIKVISLVPFNLFFWFFAISPYILKTIFFILASMKI